jgi:hypothetical protein
MFAWREGLLERPLIPFFAKNTSKDAVTANMRSLQFRPFPWSSSQNKEQCKTLALAFQNKLATVLCSEGLCL